MEDTKMKITKQDLKQIIKEETLKYISKAKEKRDRESKKLSAQRKQSWLGGLTSLGRGITEQEIQDIILQETEKYLKAEGKVIPPDKLKQMCLKIGMRTYNDFLVALNNVEKAQSGKLFDKPKVKEGDIDLIQDKNCGNPHRKSTDGTFGSNKDKGINSTYFCDKTPRKTIDGKSIKSQNCGRSSRAKGKDIKCFPD